MKTLAVAELRARLRELLDEVERTHERVVVTRHGSPVAVLLSIEELESLELTLEVLSDPEAMDDIRQSEADISAGRLYSLDQIVADLRDRGRIA